MHYEWNKRKFPDMTVPFNASAIVAHRPSKLRRMSTGFTAMNFWVPAAIEITRWA
jgi:hypothetical protein